jgi:hypothetical protein
MVRTYGPPYPTHEWDATITIADLCRNDDPRGMLAWAALNHDPERPGAADVEDEVAALFVEIYSRLSRVAAGSPLDAKEIDRLLRDSARVHELVRTAVAPRPARRTA